MEVGTIRGESELRSLAKDNETHTLDSSILSCEPPFSVPRLCQVMSWPQAEVTSVLDLSLNWPSTTIISTAQWHRQPQARPPHTAWAVSFTNMCYQGTIRRQVEDQCWSKGNLLKLLMTWSGKQKVPAASWRRQNKKTKHLVHSDGPIVNILFG